MITLNIHERVKYLRKEKLKITQEQFGKPLGLTRANIANIEAGRITVTERVILGVCEKYNIREEWLRTGKGEIFETLEDEDEYMKAATELKLDGDKLAMQAVIKYWRMPKEQKEAFKDYILSIAEACKDEE